METNLTNSLQTEDDYSFLSRTQGASLQIPLPYDRDNLRLPTAENEDFDSSPLTNGSIGENEHLFTSHHALGTAYEHMKRRLTEVEQINRSLNRRLKASNPIPDRSGLVQSMMSNRDMDVAKAWEAYSDKCKECEKLRDDLREAEQKVLKSQMDARDSTIREDMLRAKSLEEDYKKQLQQAELDIRDHKNKLDMALENLEKEKEYTEILRQSAEQRHHEMEAEITNLQQSLQDEKRKSKELNLELEKQRQAAQEILEKRENQFKEKIHELEGRILQEREERTYSDQKVAELARWRQDVEQIHISSGIPLSMSALQLQRIETKDSDRESNSGSDIDAGELINELHSLTEELCSLKKQTTYQSLMLSKICDDPKIQKSFLSINCNGFEDPVTMDVSGFGFQPPPVDRSSDGFSVAPSMDTRQLIEKSPSTITSNDEPSHLTVSRQIHMVESPDFPTSGRGSPHKIEISPIPPNLSHAFNNIRINRSAGTNLHPVPVHENEDNQTEFYSTVEDNLVPGSAVPNPALQRSNRSSESSDSGSASNTDTLLDTINTPSESDTNRVVPLIAPKEKSPHVSHPTYGNHPGTAHPMQAIWPSAGKNVAGSNSTLWPPGSASSENQSSFDVINDTASNASNQELAELFKAGVREFKVQPVIRPSRDPLPEPTTSLKHPSTVPSSRARAADFNQISVASSNVAPRRRAERHPSAVEQEETAGDRAFLPGVECRSCPVCQRVFSAGTTESYMQHHINAHFPDDND